jgi:hypothetical protein
MGNKKMRLSDNAQPLALIRSWLRFHNIPFSEGISPPTDLVVGAAPTCVHVTTGDDDGAERLQEPPGVNVNGCVIFYGDAKETAREFRRMLRAVGVREPLKPFNRGTPKEGFFATSSVHPEGERRKPLQGRVRRHRDGDDLIAFRHDKFRRAPNPNPEQIAMYENVVGMASKVFCRRNRRALQMLGLEYADALDYAWVWATTYMALYERPARGDGTQNQKLMYVFLQQQFGELWDKSLRRKFLERQSMFSLLSGDACIGGETREYGILETNDASKMRGTKKGSQGGSAPLFHHSDIEDTIVTYLDLGTKGRGSSTLVYTERELERRVHKDRLEELLRELPHDEFLARLQAASDAKVSLELDARQTSMRYLKEHKRGCRICRDAASSKPTLLEVVAQALDTVTD